MKKSFLAIIVFASACASTTPVTSPTPATGPAPRVEASILKEAPTNWHLLDEAADHIAGISVERAYRELLAGKQPKQVVLVAVIDGGVDTSHADLRANLWNNPKETANGRDDDGNGYVDDTHGWNFIGGRDGRDVDHDTFEVTRLYMRCGAGGPVPDSLSATWRADCPKIAQDYNKKKSEAQQTLAQVVQISSIYSRILPVLQQAARTDSLTTARVEAIQPSSPDVQQARQIYLQLAESGITPAVVADAKKAYEGQIQYSLNPQFDPRPIVGDNYSNPSERNYGNRDVTGPDAKHGTHVAGIIGAVRGNGIGMDGIANSVRIMSVRTVPDGDERDKDVANAIRYAADNGAQVINMSFGKSYSPYKSAVDDAVRYADSKGVLMVVAAGNEASDNGATADFPTANYSSGGRAQNWIEVGASSWKGGDKLVATFSNYGQTSVDVFAPGVDLYSTVPGGGYERDSGTSMAAPVVTGLAALIMSYYPQLTASEVKRVILESATRHPTQMVARPSSGGDGGAPVAFGTLSVTGGIVNAYSALKLAEQVASAKHRP